MVEDRTVNGARRDARGRRSCGVPAIVLMAVAVSAAFGASRGEAPHNVTLESERSLPLLGLGVAPSLTVGNPNWDIDDPVSGGGSAPAVGTPIFSNASVGEMEYEVVARQVAAIRVPNGPT